MVKVSNAYELRSTVPVFREIKPKRIERNPTAARLDVQQHDYRCKKSVRPRS
jgi:hypothetical protein